MTDPGGLWSLSVGAGYRVPVIAKARVLEAWSETPTTRGVRFEKPPGFDYRPVQFCGLELATEEGGVEYSMSLASSPTQPFLEFGARVASATPWKRAFASLRKGDEAEIDGPYGHFVLDERRPAVFVAGGIGITPLKGMMRYATDKRLPIDLRLIYSNRSPDEIAYRKELDALVQENPRARVIHTITRPRADQGWKGRTGRIDGALLKEAAQGLEDPVFYLCGLPGMVRDHAILLLEMGVDRSRIAAEQFWGYD